MTHPKDCELCVDGWVVKPNLEHGVFVDRAYRCPNWSVA